MGEARRGCSHPSPSRSASVSASETDAAPSAGRILPTKGKESGFQLNGSEPFLSQNLGAPCADVALMASVLPEQIPVMVHGLAVPHVGQRLA